MSCDGGVPSSQAYVSGDDEEEAETDQLILRPIDDEKVQMTKIKTITQQFNIDTGLLYDYLKFMYFKRPKGPM